MLGKQSCFWKFEWNSGLPFPTDFIRGQFKAKLYFCDMTLLQRCWNLILLFPSVDPNLLPAYSSHNATQHHLRVNKLCVMQVLCVYLHTGRYSPGNNIIS